MSLYFSYKKCLFHRYLYSLNSSEAVRLFINRDFLKFFCNVTIIINIALKSKE